MNMLPREPFGDTLGFGTERILDNRKTDECIRHIDPDFKNLSCLAYERERFQWVTARQMVRKTKFECLDLDI